MSTPYGSCRRPKDDLLDEHFHDLLGVSRFQNVPRRDLPAPPFGTPGPLRHPLGTPPGIAPGDLWKFPK